MAAAARAAARDVTAELAFWTRALKAPTLRESVPRLASMLTIFSRLAAGEEMPARLSQPS